MTVLIEESIRKQLQSHAELCLQHSAACHDLLHTERVVVNTRQLAGEYPAIDMLVLEAAAWLHDTGRGLPHEKGVSHAIVSSNMAKLFLPSLSFTPEQTALCCQAIATHSYSAGTSPESDEGKILQDADRLDALGAIGIARTFANNDKRALYQREEPIPINRKPDDFHYAIDHFYAKLLHLSENMHGALARNLAEKRLKFIKLFLAEISQEIAGINIS